MNRNIFTAIRKVWEQVAAQIWDERGQIGAGGSDLRVDYSNGQCFYLRVILSTARHHRCHGTGGSGLRKNLGPDQVRKTAGMGCGAHPKLSKIMTFLEYKFKI